MAPQNFDFTNLMYESPEQWKEHFDFTWRNWFAAYGISGDTLAWDMPLGKW